MNRIQDIARKALTSSKAKIMRLPLLLKYYRIKAHLLRSEPLLIPPGEEGDILVAQELTKLAAIFGEGVYWTGVQVHKRRFLFPFLDKAASWIRESCSPQSQILDICGGCGNLGLELSRYGFSNYHLADIDDIRMRWGELLWLRFGLQLNWHRESVLSMTFESNRFDVLTLLGWEAASLPYSYTLKECHRVIKPGGVIVFTYHDIEGIVEGNWDFDPDRRYSYLPYSISQIAIKTLIERIGFQWIRSEIAGHGYTYKAFFPDQERRQFPQYIAMAVKN